jgi:urease accessory protein
LGEKPELVGNKRWLAKFSGQFIETDGYTRMGLTQHFGPLRVQRPFYPEGQGCLHLYLLHPPGGLVGGDHLSIDLDVESGAHVLMTTPSAGKIYRNISDLSQGQYVSLRVGDGSILEYLPQENIIFDGADGELSTCVDIYGNGLFVGWEITCLGRHESQDAFETGRLKQSLRINHNNRPLFIENLTLVAPTELQSGRAGFQGKSVFGTFVINADMMIDDEPLQQQLMIFQRRWNDEISATVEGHIVVALTQKPGVFVARIMGNKAEWLRRCFEDLWLIIRPELLGRQACVPRIWRT